MYIKISDIAIYAGGCSKVEKYWNGVYFLCDRREHFHFSA